MKLTAEASTDIESRNILDTFLKQPLLDPEKKDLLVSTFILALRDARANVGRDPTTGNILNPFMQRSWPGALLYLILIEQIGKVLRIKDKPETKQQNAFKRALEHFMEASPNLIDALYGLRCCFAHSYSLGHIDSRKIKDEEKQNYIFLLTSVPEDPIIIPPPKKWNGNHDDYGRETVTRVGLPALGKYTEDLVKLLYELQSKNLLDIKLTGGPDELRDLYFMNITTKNPFNKNL